MTDTTDTFQTVEESRINLATYNIRSGRGGNLEIVLRAMEQMNVDLGILTEAKLTDGIYTRYSSGYNVVATSARVHNQGGVALFYKDSPDWQVESVKHHGPNVISFQLVAASQRWGVVGAYVPPSDSDTVEYITRAFEDMPRAISPILLGDLNVDLASPRDGRGQAIAAEMASLGLEDLLLHFRQRRRFRHGKTFGQYRDGQLVRSRCDYILGTDRRMFKNVSIRDPRLYTSDHFMVHGRLLLTSNRRQHLAYHKARKRFPLQPPKGGPMTRADVLFQALKLNITPPTRAERRARRAWISATTWNLVDQRSAMQKVVNNDRAEVRRLSRRIHQAFRIDRRARAKRAGEDIEAALTAGKLQDSWKMMQAWYREASSRPQLPSRSDLDAVTLERQDLYSRVAPPGDNIPILVEKFDISDAVPSEGEIAAAVRRLHRGKAPGPSTMRVDHFKEWYAAAVRENNPDRTRWDALVELVQHCYSSGILPQEATWMTIVLLPKADGGVRGIGLVEALWKLLATLINARLSSIRLHDSLHGFRAGRGTGTAIIEAKLFQQLAQIAQVPCFEIFLDLKKAYDTVNRERTLEILEGYGVGERTLNLLRTFWDTQQLVVRQAGYHGKPFMASRGVTQGDPASSTIFNIVIDAVVRYWLSLVLDGAESDDGVGRSVAEQLALFYADDGLIAARNSEWLQAAINCLTELFARVGLRMNTSKTKVMTCTTGYISTRVSSPAYKRRREGGGESPRSQRRRRVTCAVCGNDLAAGSLSQHMLQQHGTVPESDAGRPDEIGRLPDSYRVSFPKYCPKVDCPVLGCAGAATTWSNLRRHFAFRHPQDSLCILEEGHAPLPKCERCGMHVSYFALNNQHYGTKSCQAGAARMRQRYASADSRRASEEVFTINGEVLEQVSVFKYLGRLLSSNDSDWPTVYYNLKKAQMRWRRVSRVLTREGADPRVCGMFYKAVVQSVLLYSCETWVITSQVLDVLKGFHHRMARRLSGKRPYFLPAERKWVYPPIMEALEEAGLFSIEHYISVRQNTLADNVATRPILELCRESEWLSGSARRTLWWTQQDLGGME
jgi:Reverse transcriptase (RNA-dependent DNA polymerase)